MSPAQLSPAPTPGMENSLDESHISAQSADDASLPLPVRPLLDFFAIAFASVQYPSVTPTSPSELSKLAYCGRCIDFDKKSPHTVTPAQSPRCALANSTHPRMPSSRVTTTTPTEPALATARAASLSSSSDASRMPPERTKLMQSVLKTTSEPSLIFGHMVTVTPISSRSERVSSSIVPSRAYARRCAMSANSNAASMSRYAQMSSMPLGARTLSRSQKIAHASADHGTRPWWSEEPPLASDDVDEEADAEFEDDASSPLLTRVDGVRAAETRRARDGRGTDAREASARARGSA